MTTLFISLLIAVQPASPAAASSAEIKLSYRAHRSPSCRDWRMVRTGRGGLPVVEAAYNNWFHGYVTGFNAHGPDPTVDLLGTTTWAQVGAFIDDYCARNPSHLVVDSLQPLVADLINRRQAPIERQAPPVGQETRQRPRMTVTVTCRDWNESRGDGLMRVVYGGAVRGYLTAYNRWGPDPTGDALLAGNDPLIDAWIDDWCGERPAALLLQGVAPFIGHLAAERAAGRLTPGSAPAIENIIPTARERP